MSRSKNSILVLILLSLAGIVSTNPISSNLTPVIGILTQPSEFAGYDPSEWNYLAASYAKFVSNGARVVPIQWNMPAETLTATLRSVNGIIIPGGNTSFLDSQDSSKLSSFGQVIKTIINEVQKVNDEGTHLPLWGTGQGFQAIVCIIAGQSSGNYACLRNSDNFNKVSKNITLYAVERNGTMYADMPSKVEDAHSQKAISYFDTTTLIVPEIWEAVRDNFTLLAYTSEKTQELPVAISGKQYPIFGTLFHPEKNQYEWVDKKIAHGHEAVLSGHMYSGFIRSEARKNYNNFIDMGVAIDNIEIGNYNPEELSNSTYSLVYLFKSTDTLQRTK